MGVIALIEKVTWKVVFILNESPSKLMCISILDFYNNLKKLNNDRYCVSPKHYQTRSYI